MPWLVGAGYCVGMRDAAIHRIALPEDDACAAAACRGTFDNWLAMVPMSQPPYQPFLLNPFTMARIQLPVWAGPEAISKITLSSAPDSERCTVAAIAACEFTQTLQRGSIAVCRLSLTGQPPCSSSSWWYIVKAFHLQDIVFFEGKLHAVDGAEQMYAFEDQDLEKMRRWPLFRRVPAAPLSAHNKYYLVACHGRLLMVRRSFGTNRVPGGACHCHSVGFKVSAVSKDSYGMNKNSPPPRVVPIKAFEGHALFVGDACCRAFAITDESSSKIKENQICYADDESNSTPVVFLDDDSAAGWSVEGMMKCHRPPLLGSTLQSYNVRTGCFRRYQRRRRPAGAWQCVMVQRLLHRQALPPPPTTEWGASLLLWEVMKSLGANETPCYCKGGVSSNPADTHVIDLFVPVYDQNWRFTQSGRSVQEAKQEAAYEAVRFLRSRYRAILDDSPWSSIPHYHTHVDEEIYNEDEAIEDQI